MAKLIFAMAQSLDGYVAAADGSLEAPLHGPGDTLFRHFVEHERHLTASLYGRRIYELMRYWDEDQPDWSEPEREFASVWRAHPKWVASRTLTFVGPNASLVPRDVETFVRELKAETPGTIAVAGPEMAATLSDMGLLDEYHLYLRPVVLGAGKPYFAGPRPELHFIESERIGDDAVRLRYEVMR